MIKKNKNDRNNNSIVNRFLKLNDGDFFNDDDLEIYSTLIL